MFLELGNSVETFKLKEMLHVLSEDRAKRKSILRGGGCDANGLTGWAKVLSRDQFEPPFDI